MNRCFFLFSGFLFTCTLGIGPAWTSPQAQAQPRGIIKTIALEGDPTPDGNGTFGSFGNNVISRPVLNESGQVAFAALARGTMRGLFDSDGIYLYNGDFIEQSARAGDMVAGTSGSFLSFKTSSTSNSRFLTVNDSGQAGMLGVGIGDSSFGSICGVGMFRYRTNDVVSLARCGFPDPRGIGLFDSFGNHGLNDKGAMVFSARVDVPPGSLVGGIFYADDNGIETILLGGDPVPGTTNVFTEASFWGFNNRDEALLVTGHSGGGVAESVYLANTTRLLKLADRGTNAPDGNGQYEGFVFASLNDSNQVAFTATLMNTAAGAGDNTGLYLADADRVVQLAREGQVSSLGGQWAAVLNPVVNDQGVVAFIGLGGGPPGQGSGIFQATTNSLNLLVTQGDPVPGGSGTLNLTDNRFPVVGINNEGHVVFQSRFIGAPNLSNEGILLVEPDGTLHMVVREGEPLAGSTVKAMKMTAIGALLDAEVNLGGQKALNDVGQVAFWAELNDGREGVFLWTLPGPPIEQIRIDGDDVVVRISTRVGKSYQLQRRDNLNDTTWIPVGSPVPGTGGVIELRHVGGAAFGQHYYGVAIL